MKNNLESKIIIPYVSHNNINHHYFIQYKINNRKIYFKTASGLYPDSNPKDKKAYLKIIEPLLMYDQIFITSDDFNFLFTLIPIKDLIILLEEEILVLIDTESFRFINNYNPHENHVFFATEKGLSGYAGFPERLKLMPSSLKNLRNDKTISIDNCSVFINKIINDSNEDLKNPEIINLLSLGNPEEKFRDISLNNFKYNTVFYTNYFCSLSKKLGINNIYQDKILSKLVQERIGKEMILQKGNSYTNVFKNIFELEKMMDLTKLIDSNDITVKNIIDIRNSKDGIKFRHWLYSAVESHESINTIEGLSLYHEACLHQNNIYKVKNSLPYKIFTPIISLIPGVGIPITGVDSLLDVFSNNWKPNFFINDLKALM